MHGVTVANNETLGLIHVPIVIGLGQTTYTVTSST